MVILAAFDIFILKSLSQAPSKKWKPETEKEITAAERGGHHQFVPSCLTQQDE
jgi:hypothetical protein